MSLGIKQVLLGGLFIFTAFLHEAAASKSRTPSKRFNPLPQPPGYTNDKHPRSFTNSHRYNLTNWTYQIPSTVENGTAKARLEISTPVQTLSQNAALSLERPQISKVTPTSFDWWYFDAVSTSNPYESLVVTLFSASATSFPWLDPTESSVLIAYLWATFANGSSFSKNIPATLATVSGGDEGSAASSGQWTNTGFSWLADGDDLSNYEVIIESEEMGVYGTFQLESNLAPHLPCGVQSDTTTLEIVPNIGWTSLIPDAKGTVNMNIQGTPLNFQGRAYHDKNWSNQPFTSNVQSWYWGHGRLGTYSIIWFSAIAADNKTYTSIYISQNGKILVSSCDSDASIRPFGAADTTEGRYPPMAGDLPEGFSIEVSLGEEVLSVNASIAAEITSDGRYCQRWTGKLNGSIGGRDLGSDGVAVFEQFVLVE